MFTRNPQRENWPPMRSNPTPLAAILAEQIKAQGQITFAEYMDACLYHPEHGYYTKADQSERRDYITSVDVTPVFGRLLARQLHEMWTVLGRPQPFMLGEAGAGNGRLAKQILDCARESLGEFYSGHAVSPSSDDRAPNSANTESPGITIASGRVSFQRRTASRNTNSGAIFSNELFDAFAVHQRCSAPMKSCERFTSHIHRPDSARSSDRFRL